MASLADDYRFSRPPNGGSRYADAESSWQSQAANDGDDDDDDEDPIFGESSSGSSRLNGGSSTSSYAEYIRRSFRNDRWSTLDESDHGSKPRLSDTHPGRASTTTAAGVGADPTSSSPIQENTELYSVLNLDKDASTEDVLRSYRSLAVAFHPDKHRDPDSKASAQASFERVQHAYEVLSDPQKRAVYDILGEEGLKSNWQVGHRLKTQDELRAEYEKHRLKRAQADIENLIRSRTEATISLDASKAIDSSQSFLQALEAISYSDVRQLFMKTSTVSVLGPATSITYSGTMLARRGAGGGNLLVNCKHQYSPKLALEASTTFLKPRLLNTKATYSFSSERFATFESSIRSNPSSPPPFSLTYGQQVLKGLTGFIKLSSGTSYSFLMPLSQTAPFPGSPSTLTAGVAGSAYSIDVTTNQFLQAQISGSYGDLRIFGRGKEGWKLTVNGGIASSGDGASIGIGTEKRLTENTHIGLGLNVGVGNGALTLRIRVSRLGQKLSVPILLSQSASPRMILGSIVIPGIGIASLQYFYLRPRKRRRIAEKLRELREEMREEIETRRREAQSAIELLREQTERKREQERSRDGLVIVSAIYRGKGLALQEEEIRASEWDVSIPLQSLVVTIKQQQQQPRQGDSRSESSSLAEHERQGSSTLTIPGRRSKAHLIGFYDVLVGSKKELVIEYLFRGRRHRATFDDYQAVAIPMRSHLME